MANRKVGTYHVHRNHHGWGIWKVVSASADGSSSISDFVESCETGEQAFRRMYALNGWGEPKKIPEWAKKQGTICNLRPKYITDFWSAKH